MAEESQKRTFGHYRNGTVGTNRLISQTQVGAIEAAAAESARATFIRKLRQFAQAVGLLA